MDCTSCWIMQKLLVIHTFFVNIGFYSKLQNSKRAIKEEEGGRKERWMKKREIIERNHVLSIHSAPVELKIRIRTLAQGLHLKGHTWLSVLYGTLLVQDKAFWEQYYHPKKDPPLRLSSHLRVGGNLKQWWDLQRGWIISHRVPAWITTEPVWASQKSLSSAPVRPEFCKYGSPNPGSTLSQLLTTFTGPQSCPASQPCFRSPRKWNWNRNLWGKKAFTLPFLL